MLKKWHVIIRGLRPLIHNKYPLNIEGVISKVRKGTVFDPEQQAKDCLYTNTKGVIYQPAEHIEGAMIKGATQVKYKGKKSYKDIVAQNLIVQPREIKLPQEYRIDITTGVIPATRGRITIARPAWDEWTLEFDVIDTSAYQDINTGILKNIIEEAGKVGIGTFRLKYGKFEVVSVEEIVK
jgi:hypothetical protein